MSEKPRILFVEDDPDDIELTLLNFKSHGFDVEIEVARDGLQALRRLEDGARECPPRDPDLILLDLKMPRMNGLELLRALKERPRLSGIPVAFLTSSADEGDRREALELGARLFLQKPSNFDEFAGIVARLRALLSGGAAPSST